MPAIRIVVLSQFPNMPEFLIAIVRQQPFNMRRQLPRMLPKTGLLQN
jgi:hypothetical protein